MVSTPPPVNTPPPPQSNGFPPGAGSPQQAAMILGSQKAGLLASLNASARGGNKIPIAIPTPMYANANGNQGVQNQTIQSAQQNAQMSENNRFYSNVTLVPQKPQAGGMCGCDLKGGRRRKRAGTNIVGINGTWGCYSGGSKKIKRRTKRRRTKRRGTKWRGTKRRETKRRGTKLRRTKR